MTRAARCLTSTLLAAVAGAALAAEAPRPDAYAYGWTLRLGEPAEFYRLPLSREVLAASRSTALVDVALFDDDDRLVPAFIRQPEAPHPAEPALLPLPAYALAETARTAAQAKAPVTVQISSPDGTHTAVAVAIEPEIEAPGTRRWYSVVEQVEGQRWAELQVEWQGASGSFISAVEVETSPNLEYWHPVGHGAIAAFRADGGSLTRNRVALHSPPDRFVRVTLREVPEEWTLTRLALRAPQEQPEVVREWQALPFTDAPQPLSLDLGAPLAVDRFEIVLSSAGMVRAKLESADAPEGPWRFRSHAVFYRFEDGPNAAATTAIGFDGAAARHWRVTLLGHSGQPAELKLGWMPIELVFVAQGTRPFHLVAGSLVQAKAAPEVVALASDARGLWQAQKPTPGLAELGPRHELIGEAAYDPTPLPDWKTFALWALLALGVVAVLGMVLRLTRELSTDAA